VFRPACALTSRKLTPDAGSTGGRNAGEACPDRKGNVVVACGAVWAERTAGRADAIKHASLPMKRGSPFLWRITAQFYHAEEQRLLERVGRHRKVPLASSVAKG
jgi:hypothetical protein